MRQLAELSRPALGAALGGLAVLIVTAIAGEPNVAIALAFSVAFFVASSVDVLLQDRAGTGARGRYTGGPHVVGASTPRTAGGPFDRFTDHGKRVLALAQDEAMRMNHNYIGTEHLLLGIVRDGDASGARALAESGVTLEQCRAGVELTIGRGASAASAAQITLTPRTKKVIELAINEARQLGGALVGNGHLLLGLVREGDGIAMTILDSMKVDRVALQQRTRAKIAEGLG